MLAAPVEKSVFGSCTSADIPPWDMREECSHQEGLAGLFSDQAATLKASSAVQAADLD